MTLGQLKLRMLKLFPGLDLDVLEGFISDRYGEILEELPWSRLNAAAVLQTIAPYTTGSVAVTAGLKTITLTAGTWITGMTGRSIRIGSDDAFYTFTFATATTGTLDRPYEGDSATAAGYSVFQHIYALPANCRILQDDAFSTTSLGSLTRLSRDQLNLMDPSRSAVGTPAVWASYMDDTSTPPRMQVELYPIPAQAIGIPYEYTAEASAPGTASAAFLPWMEPATALVEGVTGKILRTPQFKDLAAAQLAMIEAKNALSTMRNNEAQRQENTQMQLPGHYTSHRRRRW